MTKEAKKPAATLRGLDRLVGTWKLSGPELRGTVTFEWLAGGFFLMQRGWIRIWGRKIIFIECIGYDESRRVCASHLFDNAGNLFTYEWEIRGDGISIWFGKKGSVNRFKGKFAADHNSYSGAWEWPGGGYQAAATRQKK